MKAHSVKNIVSQNDGVMNGALVFAGTRVRVETLVNHLKRGYVLDDFLRDFPSVSREQAEAFLNQSPEWARASLSEEGEANARAAG